MQYVIVENRTTVLLGPIPWKPRFIQSEFNDLEVPYQVPLGDPEIYINVDTEVGGGSATGIEIFPILGQTAPDIDPIYQHLAGPFWTYNDTSASLYYTAHDNPIDDVRAHLIRLTADQRWKKEIAGTSIDINGASYSLYTDRDNRGQYTVLSNSIGSSTVNWKFPEGFVQVNQAIAQEMVNKVAVHVQDQFDWEAATVQQIQNAASIDDLKAIKIVEPQQPPQSLSPQLNSPGVV